MFDKRSLGRKNACVIASLTEEESSNAWKTESTRIKINELGCHVYQGSSQNGYPSLSRGHAQSKIKLHILSYFIAKDKYPSPNQVVSHLCHTKMCINKDHLVLESISKNSRRNGCLHRLEANGSTWNLCSHEPRCLSRDVSNLPTDFAPSIL
jgi:hypothetical protein